MNRAQSAVASARTTLARSPEAAAQARAWVQSQCLDVSAERVDAARLLVSEFVTNSYLHTSTKQIEIEATSEGGYVRIAVVDDASGADHTAVARGDFGRGLLLVRELSSDWGICWTPKRCRVWALLPM